MKRSDARQEVGVEKDRAGFLEGYALLEIRAGLVLVQLEVAGADRSHFASLGARRRPGEGPYSSTFPPSSEALSRGLWQPG